MSIIDEQTGAAIEITSQSAKLLENILIELLKKLNDKFNENPSKDIIIEPKTKEGKQKITELNQKYEHKQGVSALPDNINKEQLKDYQKEFKKNGIDFSVIKNRKDNYSFYFASKDSEIMEKGIKNIVENKIEKTKEQDREPARFSMAKIKQYDKEQKEKEKQQPQKEKHTKIDDRQR